VTLRHHFEPENNMRLARLCGPLDAHLRRIESVLSVVITRRGSAFGIAGDDAQMALSVLQTLYDQTQHALSEEAVELALTEARAMAAGTQRAPAQRATRASGGGVRASAGTRADRSRALHEAQAAASVPEEQPADGSAGDSPAVQGSVALGSLPPSDPAAPVPVLHTRRSELRGRTPNQVRYLQQMLSQDICFGIGPAGTGKTFLAVACAVDALERRSVQRLVLTRPAVEAGERLGFLPGDLAQKVDPYLRPLYDALYDLMGMERVVKAFDKGLIEIAPLAFMRGRTLNHAFVILDEAQNTTTEQMKMFLTRMGFGSRCVVTGDTSQIDLPAGVASGLVDAEAVLQGVQGIGFTRFGAEDVVRHPLVARVVEAYEAAQRVRAKR
jgi:phosphate starvation-inducible PhoH-like protein